MTEKSNSGKYERITVIISIISLVVSLVLTVYSLHLVNQANILTEKNLELQNMLSNFTSVIIANPEVGFLYSNGFSYSNGSIYCVDHYGHLNISLRVITLHYGMISIDVKNLTDVDPQMMINPDMKNQTTVSYVYEDEKYKDVVVSGLNQLNAQLDLKSTVYPDPQQLPAKGEKIQFPIGRLLLEAKLLDVQTNKTLTEEFSALIAVIITVP